METTIATLQQAMERRHSVRSYTSEPVSTSDRAALQAEIGRCNAEGGLAIKLACDEPKAFDSLLAHYGKFTNVRNYLVLAGPDAPDLDERCEQLARSAGLSGRELDVMRLLARGRSVAVISETLGIAQGTVKHHASNTYRKLGVYDRQGLIDVVAGEMDTGRGA